MELLVLRNGDDYLRVREEGYELVNMSKASVYPVSQKEKVEKIFQTLSKQLDELKIRKLIITEEEYVQE